MKKLLTLILMGLSLLTLAACTDYSHDGTYINYLEDSGSYKLYESRALQIEGDKIGAKGEGFSTTLDYSKKIRRKYPNGKDTPFEFIEDGDVIVFTDPDNKFPNNIYAKMYYVKENSKFYKHIQANLAK